VPLISRWTDRLVRHHPVQFRCAPDGVLLTLGTPWGLFRLLDPGEISIDDWRHHGLVGAHYLRNS